MLKLQRTVIDKEQIEKISLEPALKLLQSIKKWFHKAPREKVGDTAENYKNRTHLRCKYCDWST